MRIRIKLGRKDQLVIPEVVRESVGLKTNGSALLEVKDNVMEIRPFSCKDLAQRSK